MEHLHNANYVYVDLAYQNIAKSFNNGKFKLFDFDACGKYPNKRLNWIKNLWITKPMDGIRYKLVSNNLPKIIDTYLLYELLDLTDKLGKVSHFGYVLS